LTLADLGVSEQQCSRWQRLAALDEAEYAARRAAVSREAARSVEATREERRDDKKARREAKEADLGARQLELPDKRYGVILADPPWRWEPYSRETGMSKAADNHYATQETAAIATLDVASIAAPDCVLFLWATAPMLPQALDVMKAWGFGYRTNCVWCKPAGRPGTGYWFRSRHEHLLLGAQGDIPAPAMGTQWPSAIEAALGRHSEKPEAFFELIEAYFPTLPKIELYRRGTARAGWSAWGLEAYPDEAAE
jgi:N6-adenosine-specific RNA methylase IME4